MKQILVVLAVMIVAANLSGQTRQEKDQIKMLDKEISRINKEISRSKDSLTILDKKDRVEELQNRRNQIFDQITSAEIPGEVSPCELRKRNRSNNLRRQEVVLEKVEGSLAVIQPSGLKAGYKVIVSNEYYMPTTFLITPVNGGDKTSLLLDQDRRETIFLAPGSYTVTFLNGGNPIGRSAVFNIDGSVHNYKGEECFAFVYMPRW